MKDDRITVRYDPAIGRKLRALAARRGLSVSDYIRLMSMLEIMDDEPDSPMVNQQLKDTLADVEAFAHLDPQDQVDVMRRSLDAITKVKEAADQAFTWLNAVARASDAYTRHKGAQAAMESEDREEP